MTNADLVSDDAKRGNESSDERIRELERELSGYQKALNAQRLVGGALMSSMMETPDEKNGHIARLQGEKERAEARGVELEARATSPALTFEDGYLAGWEAALKSRHATSPAPAQSKGEE